MKIAIDISQICYEGTGVATYTALLVQNLLKYDRKNNYLLVGTSLREIDRLRGFFRNCRKNHENVDARFFRIPQKAANFLGNYIHQPDIRMLAGDADIFHSSDWIEPRFKGRKVTTVHDLVYLRYPELSDPYIVKTQKKRMEWVRKESDLVIADSESTRNDLIELLNFPEDRIEVVYPGVEEIYSHQSHEEVDRVKKKYGIVGDYLLAVGTIEPRKNIQRIVNAFGKFLHHQLISSGKKPVSLVIAGKSGWGELIKEETNIKPIGMVEKIDLPGLYSGARMFIYPSLFEGFGLPVLEAFASGCPVITSAKGSLEEVAGDAALLVDPLETEDIAVKMVKLFVDKKLSDELVAKGIRQKNKFSWEKAALNVINCYESLSK